MNERQRLIPITEVAKYRGLSPKHTLRMLRQDPKAPAIYQLGKRAMGCQLGDVLDWNEASKQTNAA